MRAASTQISIDHLELRSDYDEPSVFLPENMLREARRQRHLPAGKVPSVCLLDPDGDIVRHIIRQDMCERSATWACYHTELWETRCGGDNIGVVGNAVGAPFAVLVAEELFESGCELLISVTSAGKIAADLPVPSLILINRALRGEGTSNAYLPPETAIDADVELIGLVADALTQAGIHCTTDVTWTTDAPFRETATALARADDAGAVAVEMEASALYAFATVKRRPVVCFAHVTNSMAVADGDFEKGPAEGAEHALELVNAVASAWPTLSRKDSI
jgi:uridine phosphorylase